MFDKNARAAQAEKAYKMETMLNKYYGGKYRVCYDHADSGITRFYFAGICYKQIEDGTMTNSINDYVAPEPLRMGSIMTQAEYDRAAAKYGW